MLRLEFCALIPDSSQQIRPSVSSSAYFFIKIFSISFDNIMLRLKNNTKNCGVKSVLQTSQRQKFFIWLNTLCQKLTVPKQSIGRDRCRYILCRFFISNVNNFERNTMFLRHLLHPRHPIIGIRTLIGVIKNKARFRPSAHRIQRPFFPWALASRIHASSRSFEYPCPFMEPDTHKQLIWR